MTKFQKGRSGNPSGRPRGIVNQGKLRHAIEKDIPEIVAALATAAKCGDTAASKLLLDRVLPALRPVDQPVSLPTGKDLTESGRAVLEAVSTGKMTPEQAAKLLGGIGTLARVIEVDELERRVEALEHGHVEEQG